VTTLVAIVPSVGALFLFWVALRAILQADRRERVAQARIEAAEDRSVAEAARSRAVAQDGGGTEPVAGSVAESEVAGQSAAASRSASARGEAARG
jgi:hypothetical protein